MGPNSGVRKLVLATADDVEAYWRINNHPSVRAVAFSTEPIPWQTHREWYSRALLSNSLSLFVGKEHEQVISVVRFEEISAKIGEISVAVAPEDRQKGVGGWTVSEGSSRYFRLRPRIQQIRAYVRAENAASRRLFLREAFVEVGERKVKGLPAIEFILHRD